MAAPWYDFRKYASYDTWTNRQSRCIAPTLYENNRLCNCTINYADLNQALSFKSTAENLVCGPERNAAIRNFILLLCCEFGTHRSKLSVNRDGVLLSLVSEYGHKMRSKGSATVKREPQSHDMTLFKPAQKASFTPFTPQSNETVTVHQEIIKPVDSMFTEEGTLYVASWPQSPDFVKIGYTSASDFDRIAKQAKCFSGMKLSASFNFSFPEKIERLVHRELRAHRYKIEVCDMCGHGHVEWFKTPVLEAVKVISDWFRLVHIEPLYDAERKLRAFWGSKVNSAAGDITARKLLDDISSKISPIVETKPISTTSTTEVVKVSEISELLKEIRMLREELKSVKAPAFNDAQPTIKTEPEAVTSKATVATPAKHSAINRPIMVKFPETPTSVLPQLKEKAYRALSKPLSAHSHPTETGDKPSPITPSIFNDSATIKQSLQNEAKVEPFVGFAAPEKPKGLFSLDQRSMSNTIQSTTTGTAPLFKFGTPLGSNEENKTLVAPVPSTKSTPEKSFFGLTLTPPPTLNHKKPDPATVHPCKPTFEVNQKSKPTGGASQTLFTSFFQTNDSLSTPSKPSSTIFGLSTPTTVFGKDSKAELATNFISTPTRPRSSLSFVAPSAVLVGSLAKNDLTTTPYLPPSKSSGSGFPGNSFTSITRNTSETEPMKSSDSASTKSTSLVAGSTTTFTFASPKTKPTKPTPSDFKDSSSSISASFPAYTFMNAPITAPQAFESKQNAKVDLARSSTTTSIHPFSGNFTFEYTITSKPEPKKPSGDLWSTTSPVSALGTYDRAARKTSSTPSFSQGIGFGSAAGTAPSFSFIPNNWFATSTTDASNTKIAASIDKPTQNFQIQEDEMSDESSPTDRVSGFSLTKKPRLHQNETGCESDSIKLDKQSSPLSDSFFTSSESATANLERTQSFIPQQSIPSNSKGPISPADMCHPDPSVPAWKLTNKILQLGTMVDSNNATHHAQNAPHISTATANAAKIIEKMGTMDEIAQDTQDIESDTDSCSSESTGPATMTSSIEDDLSVTKHPAFTTDSDPVLTFFSDFMFSLTSEPTVSMPVTQTPDESDFGGNKDTNAKPDLDLVLTFFNDFMSSLAIDVQKVLISAEDIVKGKTSSVMEAIVSNDVGPVLTFFE